ncbi:MAG: hypothetical protein ACRC5H_09915 [Treponemataceae bacterium]
MPESIVSPVAQIIIAIIPIVGIVIGGIVMFFYILWRHKQVTLLIKNNNYNPTQFNLKIFALLVGLLLIAVGVVLTPLFLLIEKLSYTLLGGLIPFALGVGMIIFYKLYR